jgi:probable phosphoglycerate mutase
VLVLVRHGESTANAEGLLLGRTDAPLTDKGVAQAEAVAAVLAATPVNQVRASPLLRAMDTAELLGWPGTVELDDRWLEVDYGEHEGRPLSDVPAEVWRHWRDDPSYQPAGGESLASVHQRVSGACDELFERPGHGARSTGGDVVVVSHVSPIKAAVAWSLGAGHELAFRLHLSTGSITRIGWGPGGPMLQTYNEVPPPV